MNTKRKETHVERDRETKLDDVVQNQFMFGDRFILPLHT